jgi:hypothetical protein
MKAVAMIAAIALSAAPPAFAATSDRDGATLRLRDRAPLVVAGSGFLRGERVRIVLSGETAARGIVRAGRAGAFVVTFADTTVHRCDLVRVVATGGRGSRATLKVLPPPACRADRAP